MRALASRASSRIAPARVSRVQTSVRRPRAPARALEREENDREDDEAASSSSAPDASTPEWARDLVVNESGDLIVESTGLPLNEFGATRFDLYVRALRGEYDVAHETTERDAGEIFESIQQFPCKYTFQIVCLKTHADDEAFVRSCVATVVGEGGSALAAEVTIKERGHTGKWAAIWVSTFVFSAREVNERIAALKEDDRVRMCY